MQNMMILDDKHIQTPYGVFGDVVSYDVYGSGELKSVMVEGKNMVLTHAGELVPAYTENNRRKYKPSVEFYRDGMIKSVYLEEQQDVETPIGDFPAELITFYETGEVKRVFPLDGKISGYWSEEDEKGLNIPLSFSLGFAEFTAMISGICFYKDGDIRSITLYPGEKANVNTKYGNISVRNGFSLYESGALMSCEPNLPSVINTPIGKIVAYDNDANGITADSNSLCFYEDGNVKSLITFQNKIAVQTNDERLLWFMPQVIPAIDEDGDDTLAGLKVEFKGDTIVFNGSQEFKREETGFTILPFMNGMPMCSPSDCANCSLCGG